MFTKKSTRSFILLISLALVSSLSMAMEKAEIGTKAPDFTLMDHNGQKVSLSDFKDKVVVLEWTNPDCPFVVRHYRAETMKKLSSKYKSDGVVWLAVNSTHYANVAANKKFVEDQKLDYPVLDDHTGQVGKLYGARTTPHMFVIHNGKLVYNGAIDDDPRGNGPKINYVDKVLTQVNSGKAVSNQKMKPYGCSVKYAKTNS